MPPRSSVPSHSADMPERPRRTIAWSRVSTSGTKVCGSIQPARSEKDLQFPARVERNAIKRQDVTGLVPTPQSLSERVAR
jgi:hypothetical protein